MSSEEKSDKVEKSASEARGITEQFVNTLGLKDLIAGGYSSIGSNFTTALLFPTYSSQPVING
jgi:hypothetical protein